jgi:hypothetical protein
MSRLAFGGDNVGATCGARAQAMLAALESGRCNTVVVNLNEIRDRSDPKSAMYVREEDSQLWEVRGNASPSRRVALSRIALTECARAVCGEQGHVLHTAFGKGSIRREQTVVVAAVNLADKGLPPGTMPSGVAPDAVSKLVEDGLHTLGLELFDVLLLRIPSSPQHFSVGRDTPDVVRLLESQRAAGRVGSYGFACSALTAAEAVDRPVLQPVRSLLATVENVYRQHGLSCLSYE